MKSKPNKPKRRACSARKHSWILVLNTAFSSSTNMKVYQCSICRAQMREEVPRPMDDEYGPTRCGFVGGGL